MNEKYRLFIVEDHTLLRASLRALLLQDADIEIVGEARNGSDAIQAAGALLPHLVLMDLHMPGMNGIEALREIKRRHPETRVLVLTMHKAAEYVHASLRAGADGYILKDVAHEELRVAIGRVRSGKRYLSRCLSTQIIAGLMAVCELFSALWLNAVEMTMTVVI